MNKIKLIGAVLLAAVIIPTSGCKTVNGESVPDMDRICATVKEAAAFGSQEALIQHPEWKPYFDKAAGELRRLENAPTVSVNEVLAIVGRLPVKELKSSEARLAIGGARILISGLNVGTVDMERVQDIKSVVAALRDGLEQSGVTPVCQPKYWEPTVFTKGA